MRVAYGGEGVEDPKGSKWATEPQAQSLCPTPQRLPHDVGGIFSVGVCAVLIGKDEARIC